MAWCLVLPDHHHHDAHHDVMTFLMSETRLSISLKGHGAPDAPKER
jgi:hypothetical protein